MTARGITLLAVAVALAIATPACGSSGGVSSDASAHPATTTTNAADAPGTAKITQLDVPASVQCSGGPSTTFSVQYATSDAKHQDLIVDGRVVPGTDSPSGSVDAPVHCDAVPHTVVLIAYDATEHRTAQQKILMTLLPS